MAPRRLWGWEPRTFTRYVFEGGVKVGEVTYREPEFDQSQMALLFAHAKLPAPPPHGIPMDVATNADNQFMFDVEGPTVDWAANTLAVRQEAFYKQYPDANRAGHLWTVKHAPDKRVPGS